MASQIKRILMTQQTKPIAETNRFIVLDKYVPEWEAVDSYQSEADLERELVKDLEAQGYEFLSCLLYTSPSPRDS